MRVRLVREFRFEAAHRLPNVPPGHKCARLHGHSFVAEVAVAGEVDPRLGWFVDYADISRIVDPVVARLDHYPLNEVEGLENPTSEHVARWIWDRIRPGLVGLEAVSIRETCTARCEYRGE